MAYKAFSADPSSLCCAVCTVQCEANMRVWLVCWLLTLGGGCVKGDVSGCTTREVLSVITVFLAMLNVTEGCLGAHLAFLAGAARLTGSADIFAARWDGGLPGGLAAGRRPAFGLNSVNFLGRVRDMRCFL